MSQASSRKIRRVHGNMVDRPDVASVAELMEDLGPVIYYARISGYIKIGFTTNLTRRFREYPPDARLLAWKTDATLAEERALHRRLHMHHPHHGNEWYTPTPALMAVVNAARAECGVSRFAADLVA